jgi:HEPN domain-containing protein
MEVIFPEYVWAAISPVFDNIKASLSVERIYLLSFIRHKEAMESIFISEASEEYSVDALNILILTSDSEQRERDEIQDIVENRLGLEIPVTAFVLPVQQFKRWFENGHPFAKNVVRNCRIFYDAGNVPMIHMKEDSEADSKLRLKNDFNKNLGKVVEFLAGAELFIVRKQYELAAFHLHQAAEQAYSGIIRLKTGLQVQTHNIDKLYRYSKFLVPGLRELFPRDLEYEKKLFQNLHQAYIGGRYKIDFSIKSSVAIQLLERIKKLLIICQGLAQDQLIIVRTETA